MRPFPFFAIPGIRGPSFLVLALFLFPGIVEAQGEGECDVPSHGGLVMTTLSSLGGESRLLEFKSPVISCPGGVRISADSARVYEATNYNQLFGNVVFTDQDSRLTANQAQSMREEAPSFKSTPADTLHVFIESLRNWDAAGREGRQPKPMKKEVLFWI